VKACEFSIGCGWLRMLAWEVGLRT